MPKIDVLSFKLECAKMFLKKFCQHGSNFRRKIQLILEYVSRESDKNTAMPPLRSLKMRKCDVYYKLRQYIYRKANKFPVHWKSQIPKRYKRHAVNGDLYRSWKISSNFFHEKIEKEHDPMIFMIQ